MAQIGLNISISGLTGKLLIRWVRAAAPLTQVGRSAAFDFPYDDVYVISDIAPVVYIVQLWRSDDGVALDQLIKDWSVDASKDTRSVVTTYQYKVGRGDFGTAPDWADPVGGQTTLTDQRIDGFTKEQLLVHEAGYGNKLDAEYDLVSGGGIELLDGKQFDEGVAWFITTFSTEIVTLPPTNGNPKLYADIEIITEDRDFFVDESDNLYNKLCIASKEGSVLEIVFPDLADIPDDTYVTFQTQQGLQHYLKLQFDPGDTVWFLNQQENVIYLAKNEKITLYFKAGVCYVIDYDGNALKRGMISHDYDSNRDSDRGGLLYADESTGELSRDDYPALYEFIAALSGSAVCSLGIAVGQWSYSNAGVYENKQKYGIDTVAFTFRVPHLSGLTPKLTGTPGNYESDQVGEFSFTGYKLQKSGTSNHVHVIANIDDVGPQPPPPFTFNAGKITRVKSYSQKPFVIL